MKLTVNSKHFKLALKHPFTISRYTVSTQSTVIVSISNGEFTGYGEATVNPYYHSSVEKIQGSIQKVKPVIERSTLDHPTLFWKSIEPLLADDYFTLCAVDCAYWDLYAKIEHRTLRSFWSEDAHPLPLTNYTIGIDTIEKMQAKILEKPWPIYKIKLGTGNDVEIIKELRAVTDSVFRIDANASWSVDGTLKNMEVFQRLGVEFIEQPLKATDWEGMKCLKEKCVIPIIADESCQRVQDIDACAAVFHGINIKLMKCGGITPALDMITKCRAHHLLVMAGCMTESSIGISNLSQLGTLLDYIDADGAMLLEKDIAQGVRFQDGNMLFSEAFGAGSSLL